MLIELRALRCRSALLPARLAEGHALGRLLGYTWYQQLVPHDLSGFHCYPSRELWQ